MRGVDLLRGVGSFIFIVPVLFAFIVIILLVLLVLLVLFFIVFVMNGDAVRN